MTIEERLKAMLGEAQFQLAVMATQLEEAQKRIAELERTPSDEKLAKPTLVPKDNGRSASPNPRQ